MTERSESERAERIADAIKSGELAMIYCCEGLGAIDTPDDQRDMVESALRRLAAQDQKPVAWHPSNDVPNVGRGSSNQYILAVYRKHSGKVYSFAAEYLNAYPLRYEYGCPKGSSGFCDECSEDGCPTTGWHVVEGADDDGYTYHSLTLDDGDEVKGWREVPQWGEALSPPPAAGDGAQDTLEEERIDRLRLTAFKSNDANDRQAYFDAASKWFQDRHYRRLAAQDQKPTSVRLEARPAGSDKDWIEIFPSQLSGMAKVGHDVRAIEIAPPDSGAGKSTEVQSEYERGFEAGRKSWGAIIEQHKAHTAELENTILPDHGRADAGVKPLEWISCTDGTYHDTECRYEITAVGKFFRLVRASMGGATYCCDADSVEACKETAQYDHEKRILSALSKPAPVAANASAELQNDLGEMLRALDMSDAAQPMSPHEVFQSAIAEMKRRLANASAEARLREALEPFAALVPSAFDHSYPDDAEIVLVCNGEPHAYLKNINFRRAAAAISAHPHASDCDKQGQSGLNTFAEMVKAAADTAAASSDRTADVTEDEMAEFIRMVSILFGGDAREMAVKVLDAFTVGRR